MHMTLGQNIITETDYCILHIVGEIFVLNIIALRLLSAVN